MNSEIPALRQSLALSFQQTDVVNGFSFTFASRLLSKLRDLKMHGQMVRDGYLTETACALARNLDKQIYATERSEGSYQTNMSDHVRKLSVLMSTAEEFLATLADPPPIKPDGRDDL